MPSIPAPMDGPRLSLGNVLNLSFGFFGKTILEVDRAKTFLAIIGIISIITVSTISNPARRRHG